MTSFYFIQVKRLTMGLLRSTEESRPLVHHTSNASPSSGGSTQTISDGYVNEGICDPDKVISSKFGDSCRKSLTSVLDKGTLNVAAPNEFDFKKNLLRETSSGECNTHIILHIRVNRGFAHVFRKSTPAV